MQKVTSLLTICIHSIQETTVLITTHYIDEAKKSNLVGFLRSGQMLAEESPLVLMKTLKCNTLEEAFYKLCLWTKQSGQIGNYECVRCDESVDQNNNHTSIGADQATSRLRWSMHSAPGKLEERMACGNSVLNWDHLCALMYREFVLSKHNVISFVAT